MYIKGIKCGKGYIGVGEPFPVDCGISPVYKESGVWGEITLYRIDEDNGRYFVVTYGYDGKVTTAGISDNPEEAWIYAMGRVLDLKLRDLKESLDDSGDISVVSLGIAAELRQIIDVFDKNKNKIKDLVKTHDA